jgi:hypothetical protein
MGQALHCGVAWMAFLVATPLTTSQPTMQLFQQILRHVRFAHCDLFCPRNIIASAKWRGMCAGIA